MIYKLNTYNNYHKIIDTDYRFSKFFKNTRSLMMQFKIRIAFSNLTVSLKCRSLASRKIITFKYFYARYSDFIKIDNYSYQIRRITVIQ